jgi:hypothetical protein
MSLAPERQTSLPSGKKKKTKKPIKPNFQPDPQNHLFPGPTACSHAAFPSSSLQIKSFWPLLLESTFAFYLKTTKNPQHLKIPAYHLHIMYVDIYMDVYKCVCTCVCMFWLKFTVTYKFISIRNMLSTLLVHRKNLLILEGKVRQNWELADQNATVTSPTEMKDYVFLLLTNQVCLKYG